MESQASTFEPVADPSDAELVRAAQIAIPAFEHLYRRYVNDVYRYCRQRLNEESDAADATSQVFVRALTNIRSCRQESFRAWLFAIARNVVIDTWRQSRVTVDLADAPDLADPAESPEVRAIAAEDRQSVLAALAYLTEEQRTVVEFRLAGLSGGEIAVLMGKSRNAVDQAQFRALNRMRAVIGTPTQFQAGSAG
ncbi:MAG: sigma-70 family RNA polymerase sigma factor [Chloroflexota bacterium]|nr:sigma-70 family RNA polymerase sigma factor [Chloroflexota bacterium]